MTLLKKKLHKIKSGKGNIGFRKYRQIWRISTCHVSISLSINLLYLLFTTGLDHTFYYTLQLEIYVFIKHIFSFRFFKAVDDVLSKKQGKKIIILLFFCFWKKSSWQWWDSNPRHFWLVPKTSTLDHSATLPSINFSVVCIWLIFKIFFAWYN